MANGKSKPLYRAVCTKCTPHVTFGASAGRRGKTTKCPGNGHEVFVVADAPVFEKGSSTINLGHASQLSSKERRRLAREKERQEMQKMVNPASRMRDLVTA